MLQYDLAKGRRDKGLLGEFFFEIVLDHEGYVAGVLAHCFHHEEVQGNHEGEREAVEEVLLLDLRIERGIVQGTA